MEHASMTRALIEKRWHRRFDVDERGFTIVETVAALGIMFMLLMSLAYVVSSGLSYQRAARIRQTANGLANQVMEQIRGLPYESIQNGLRSNDIVTDANILPCSGTYRLFACTASASSIPGTGEAVVHNSGLTTTTPLVPHVSSSTVDGVAYEWSTYISQGAESADGDPAPYRVTVEVAWTAASGDKVVRIQSLFWSPSGCRSLETHPYAAPCQAFFYGKATVPAGTVSIEPTSTTVGLNNTSFDGGELSLGGVNASIQQEQVVQSLASFTAPHADVVTNGVTTTVGAIQGPSNADSDPNTASGAYQRVRCGTEVACAAATASSPSSASPDRMTFTLPTSTTAESAASVQAATGEPCPPSNVATSENDDLACAGASYVQPSDIFAQATLGGTSPNLGTFDIVRVSAPATTNPAPLRAVTHRVTNPTTNVCSPAADTDGCTTMSAYRAYGTIALGGLPPGLGTPTGWLGSYVRVTNYADSATASVGTNAPYPTTSDPAPAGELLVYNGTGYESINMTSTLTAVTRTSSVTSAIAGTNVTATFTLDGSQAANASAVLTSAPTSSGTTTRTDATAQMVAPVIAVRYQLSIAGTGTVLDLTTTLNLGTLDLDASYAEQPEEGS
jgi:type II secretory pathway pseudopilin PulG